MSQVDKNDALSISLTMTEVLAIQLQANERVQLKFTVLSMLG